MVRHRFTVALLATGFCLNAAISSLRSEEPPPPPEQSERGERPPPPKHGHKGPKHLDDKERSERMREFFKKRIESLPPEQRKKMMENFERWKNMSEEERQKARERFHNQEKFLHQGVKNALEKSGLQLDDEQREAFTLRYIQERQRVEETLRKEFSEKRRQMMDEVVDKLREEFSGKQTPKQKSPSSEPAKVESSPES